MRVRMLVCIALLVCLTGCLPRTLVKKNPGADDTGIRYYRPKPYLSITPMLKADGTPADGMVTLELQMLPDFSEEYSIHVKTGLGSNKTNITLKDGWNLTQINVDVDSNFDENTKAVADLASKVATLTAGVPGVPQKPMVVHATNVPIGLYESVIAEGPDCKKHLYGFRYVGFLPYSPCPTTMSGGQSIGCEYGEVYGLFFESGTMVFRPLSEGPTMKTLKTVDDDQNASGDQDAPLRPSVEDGFET